MANGMFRRSSMIRMLAMMLSLALFMAMTGCSTVVPATSHPPTTADRVTIYTDKPAKYEILGTLRVAVSPSVHWDEHGNADAGFEQLKAAAAAEGANGIMLIAPPGEADAHVLAGYNSTFYSVPIKTDPRTAIVQAIYVIKP